MTDDRVNILLVDDRQENLLALEAILESLGQNLDRHVSAQQAILGAPYRGHTPGGDMAPQSVAPWERRLRKGAG